MRSRSIFLVCGLAALVIFASRSLGQTDNKAEPATNSKSAPAPKRDLSGVWIMRPGPGGEGPGGEMPPMTPWAQAKYDANKPGYGPKATPNGNDPILQCDPMGLPRVLFFLTAMEFANIPGRTIVFFERDHAWREIWTDGRKLPDDPDPTWYGYSIGHWDGDYTFVVESNGFDDRTWLGAQGQPHSDEMRLEERYHRVDHDTIDVNITINDPKAYTKTWQVAQRTLRLEPHTEIPSYFCVWSEENSFRQRIRTPAATPAK